MKTRENRFSIRKLSVGASSVVVATLLFMGGSSAQAAEKQQEVGTPETASAQSIGDKDTHATQKGQVQSTEQDKSQASQTENNTNNSQTSLHNEHKQTDDAPTTNETTSTSDETHQSTTVKSEKPTSNSDNQQTEAKQTSKQSLSTDIQTSKPTTNDGITTQQSESSKQEEPSTQSTDTASKEDDTTKKTTAHTQSQTDETSDNKKEALNQPHSNVVKSEDANTSSNEINPNTIKSTEQQQSTESKTSDKPKVDNQQAQSQPKDNDDNQGDALKTATQAQQQTLTKKEATTSEVTNRLNTQNSDNSNISIDGQTNPTLDSDKSSKQNKDAQSGLNTLKNNAVATTNTQSKSQAATGTKDQTNKVAKQAQYKNQDPIILVHGFNGFTDDINPSVLAHYWGGDKLNIRQDLEENGYESYEASISAFGSNYDCAVELYYYIKGGTVDYGAAHAAKYGHERYGKTYEGVYKDWQPGQKVHLVGHSMDGQTIRQLEALLRNGNPEEQEYQRVHGGDISPLYQGQNDNMISSITTLGTPHNGTHASDLLGNEALIRQVVFDAGKVLGNKDSRVDFGLSQWGLKQQPNESYVDYVKRVKDSKLWQTKDNGFYDLTREGATNLNRQTSLNPNIVYKTYTGESTHASLFGRQKSDLNLFFPFTLTANVIGKAAEKEWRENDGLVSVISSQHPFNQAYTQATDINQKGVWQVTPTKHDWDHVDFVGQDSTDTKRTRAELQQFWHGLADDLVQSENLTRNA
ncbi:YSIRK-type signal peptide-containing protein [Staphylococcus haemolyticus]|uniref:YSIRK-targeted triacylglycerol lipase n=1 Tax=Staphylococcus haemolyticus TaxID=1283 RepID=UPI00290351BE|nr:YSIRK-type signal peptide-containing protein [Staphylococcus haemolyticus]MDU0448146.1 YSIRK-type signal peptide-containing protein [Staphylococcus haemolyticus]MDU0489560.1 YSIRK-type signal peptide-containing protein [Staphylococcus haemolyticus]